MCYKADSVKLPSFYSVLCWFSLVTSACVCALFAASQPARYLCLQGAVWDPWRPAGDLWTHRVEARWTRSAPRTSTITKASKSQIWTISTNLISCCKKKLVTFLRGLSLLFMKMKWSVPMGDSVTVTLLQLQTIPNWLNLPNLWHHCPPDPLSPPCPPQGPLWF